MIEHWKQLENVYFVWVFSTRLLKHCTRQDDLKDALMRARNKLVVVNFHASLCIPCKDIAPEIEVNPNGINNKKQTPFHL